MKKFLLFIVVLALSFSCSIKLSAQNTGEYTGQYVNGKKQGQGTMMYSNGDKYTGEWLNDKQNGNGIMEYSYGDRYEGEWRNGLYNGLGIMITNTGTKYVGYWKNGQMNGLGTFTYRDGDKVECNWEKGRIEGKGTYTWNNGDYFIGEFHLGKLKKGTKYSKDGSYLGCYEDYGYFEGDDTKLEQKAYKNLIKNERKKLRREMWREIGLGVLTMASETTTMVANNFGNNSSRTNVSHSQTNSVSTSSINSNLANSSTSSKSSPCNLCKGTKVYDPIYVAAYNGVDKVPKMSCSICDKINGKKKAGTYDKHTGHKKCPSCNGTGLR